MNDPLDPGKGPKKVYVERFYCRVMDGLHVISFGSGEEEARFVMTLPGSKALARALAKQVQKIEDKTGTKVPDLGLSDEPMLSPIKIDGAEDK